jgi:hypothetical protein
MLNQQNIYCTILYYTILYCTILYYTMLWYVDPLVDNDGEISYCTTAVAR